MTQEHKEIVSHIRCTTNKGKLGYKASLQVTDVKSGTQYRISTKIIRCWPADAIVDAMREAEEIAELNGMKFKPTHKNAGDVYHA